MRVPPDPRYRKYARRCYFNVVPGSRYCPGHQDDPEGACDVAAVGRYQYEHGVDYPCGREDDTVRLFKVCPYCEAKLDRDEEHAPDCEAKRSAFNQLDWRTAADYEAPPEDDPRPDGVPTIVKPSGYAHPSDGVIVRGVEDLPDPAGFPEGTTLDLWRIEGGQWVRQPDYHIKGGVPVPMTPEDVERGLKAADDALKALDAWHREGAGTIGGELREEDYLDGTVQLSNKGCPRYYAKPGASDPDAEDAPPKRCGCPRGRCWYDEQLGRRAQLKRAITPEAWQRQIANTASALDNDEPVIAGSGFRPSVVRQYQQKPELGLPRKKNDRARLSIDGVEVALALNVSFSEEISQKNDRAAVRAARGKPDMTLEEAQAGLAKTEAELARLKESSPREAQADHRDDAGARRGVPMDKDPADETASLERSNAPSQGPPGTPTRRKKRKKKPRSLE